MRVALLSSTYPVAPGDAVAPWAADFAEQLAAAGAHVVVLTHAVEESHRSTDRVEVRAFPWRGHRGRVVTLLSPSPRNVLRIASYFLRGRRALREVVDEWRPDAVIALWAVPMGLLARVASGGVPYAVWALGADIYRAGRNPFLRPFVRAALRGAALRWADGEELRREVEELSGLPCGFLPTGRTLPAVEPARFERPGILFVGRLEPVKAPEILLEAAALLADRGVEFELHLAGTGSLEDGLRRQAARVGAPVVFHGDLGAEALAALHRGAACVTIPSRAESIPVVFGEALQARTPLVVSDVGDMGKLGRSGAALVVPPEDAEALARALARVVRGEWRPDPERLDELARTFDPGDAARRALAELAAVAR